VDHEEGEQRAKPNVVHLKEVACPDAVILQERSPTLTVSRRTESVDVPLDGAFGDSESELQELPPDSLCSPGAVLDGHTTDKLDGLRWDVDLPQFSGRSVEGSYAAIWFT